MSRPERIGPSDPGYDPARRVFNGLFDRRPQTIFRCRSADEVRAAVEAGRAADLRLAIRSGGHSIAGLSSVDDGVVVDLSPMKSVRVNAERTTVSVGAGATWADVDAETQKLGLAAPGGVVSHTGVAGLVLNGGIGWLRNLHGLSCDNLVSAEMITASGLRLRASEHEHPELLWALRGGGGNFGVVTELDLALHPVGPTVAAAFPMYPLETARTHLEHWRQWVETAPDAASSEVVLWTLPDAPEVVEAVRGRPVVIPSAVYAGPLEVGQRTLEPLRQKAGRLHEIPGPLPFVEVQKLFDGFFPNDGSVLAYWKSVLLRELDDAALDLLAELALSRSSSQTMIVVQHMGTGVRAVPPEATAFHRREARYVVNLMGRWSDRSEAGTHTEWVRAAARRLAPFGMGAPYLNYEGATDRETPDLVKSAFGPNYPRLVEVKTRYDPDNVFRLNQNIPPRSSQAAR